MKIKSEGQTNRKTSLLEIRKWLIMA